MKFVDLTGKRFGRWTVIGRAGYNLKQTQIMWACLCDCGATKRIIGHLLRTGVSKSCGCFRKEKLKKIKTKHGGCDTVEYQAWATMTRRCRDQKHPFYHRYGGRGIRVCDEWINSFQAFLDHVGPKPSPSHSIGRKNNDGHYEPGNVEWQTQQQQSNNICTNHMVEFEGQQWTMANLARHCGVKYTTLRARLRRGWKAEDAVKCVDS